MKNKYCIRFVSAATGLLFLSGCGKQEPAAASSDAGKGASAQGSESAPAPTPAEVQNANQTPPAAPKPETVSETAPAADTSSPAAVPPANVKAPALPTASAVAAQVQPAVNVDPAVSPGSASGTGSSNTPASALQGVGQGQPTGLAQAMTNESGTLASDLSNQVTADVGLTNQAASMTTNQVAVLLERAKSLTSNQQYQEALSTVTQLYNTKLTPAQKMQVDQLKSQIQTALAQKAAAGASSALGNFFGGKKQ